MFVFFFICSNWEKLLKKMVKTSDEFVNLSGSSDAAPNPESTNPDFLSHKICFDMLEINF
jgi:hypothetical protein